MGIFAGYPSRALRHFFFSDFPRALHSRCGGHIRDRAVLTQGAIGRRKTPCSRLSRAHRLGRDFGYRSEKADRKAEAAGARRILPDALGQSKVHLGAANAYGRAARLVKDYLGSAPEK